MGLIKAGMGALGGTLADQWKEFFYCEALGKDVLVTKGQKRITGRSSNKKGNDNIISNGSGIAVADGQCMLIVEQGRVVEVCAEPGEFTYDTSSEPSIFAGNLGESIRETFKVVGKRFTFGGDTGKDQRVYYINTKEMGEILYGTATPIPFRVVVNEELGYKLSVDLRCNGNFTYRISDPLLFYTNVCGNVESDYESTEIAPRLKGELMTALQPALSTLSAKKIQYYEIPAHTLELSDALNDVLSKTWKEKRGIEVFSFNINSLSIPDDQRLKLTEWEENAMTTNPNTAAARLVGGQIDAMKAAANNNAGAMTGFMGMGMAMNAGGMGGMNAQNLFAMGQQQNQAAAPQPAAGSWTCKCGATATGKFCPECGSPKPADSDGWTCSCGTVNKGKFCQNCGAKKPAGAPLYRCDKCGWEPEDPAHPPKFCPECGDPFDDGDITN
jgi:membrane protease subunit (stomatin/prohibitin family)